MRVFHALCAVFALIANAGASIPRLDDITEYFRTSLSPRQGAPTVVNALAQTSDGYLWIATPTGLYRFDGVRFDRIDTVGTERLLGESIATLVATRSGRGLWIGYGYGGASFIEGDTLRNYPLESGLPRGTVKALAVGTDGTVWAGTSRGLARFDGQRWIDVTDALGLPSAYIQQVLADKSGNLWIAAGDKMAVLRPGAARVHVYAIPGDNVFQEDPAGRIWTMQTTPACLYLLDATRDDVPACRPLPRESFALWLVDQTGNLWVSDTADHMRVLPIPDEGSAPAAQPTTAPAATRPFVTFSGGEPNCALQDREGNVWLGTPVGLEQMRVARLRSHGPFGKIVVLGSGNHNSLWVGTTHPDRPPGQDFFQLDHGVLVPHAGGPTMITATYRDSTGVLWVGGYGRLWKLEDREWKEIPTPPELCKALLTTRARAQSMALDTSGALWLSVAQAGLFRLEAGQWQRVLVPDIPPSEYPSAIHADSNGSVWLGYPHDRIATLTHGTWRLYTEKDGITVGSVQAFGKVHNEIWAGGDRGLARVRAGRFEPLSTLNALGGVTGLLQTKSGDLWLSTAVGAVHIAPQELGRLDESPGRAPSYQTFDFLDGMPGIAPALRPMPSVLQSDDGRLWFEANNSFASIDPTEHISNTLPPTVIIGSVTDDGRRRNSQASLATLPSVRNVAIEYTATSLSIPSRVRFKYRLEGFEQAWQDVGTRRTAYYNNLPPGRYAFHVMAANEDGVWNSQGALVSLIVPPVFYQTFWFRAVCLAILALLISVLFSVRLRQVTERQRKRLEQRMSDRLNERTRIARELHDSLLQGFQGLMFRLQAVRQLLPERPADAASVLDSSLEAGDQAIGEGRDAIQNLRSSTFDDHDLPTALGTLGVELGVGIETRSQPQYRVVVEGRPRDLVPILRDDIYRIAREAVRNAYQHANARHIETEVNFGEKELRVRVRDDGIGVDPQILIRGRRAGHWGLPGMRERSESLGGQLDVWSEKNAGTEIELRISAQIAYARPPISAARRSLWPIT